jgi:hypothetical protein
MRQTLTEEMRIDVFLERGRTHRSGKAFINHDGGWANAELTAATLSQLTGHSAGHSLDAPVIRTRRFLE